MQGNEVKRCSLEELKLTSYRNFDNFFLRTESNPVVILGQNGVGKTNILESISLLFPGKGLKNTKFDDICPKGNSFTDNHWNVEAKISSPLGKITLSSFYNRDIDGSKRSIFFNGSKITNAELARVNSVIWLTPQMDYIFIGPSSDRRRFFDRMVYTFDPEHSARINKYEYYVRERAILLQSSRNPQWLSLLEEKIAETSVAIAFARLQTLHALQESIISFESEFIKAQLSLEGDLESIAENFTALELENLVKEKLYNNREIDTQTKRTNFGSHRTDLNAFHPITQKPANICSTGEQKSLLISIILAEIYAKSKWTSTLPIVLLDEVTVHLDAIRRKSLLEHLIATKTQFWITANNIEQIGELPNICLVELKNVTA
ncbi:MAG: recF [Rickettsiaceae bacterium]|jgi:DNA replication and repair protein RecF|nr:recF [Rickettsiaceae bacterium]